jgi:hypothetical protein
MGVMVNPPKPGDISYLKFDAERLSILPLKILLCPDFILRGSGVPNICFRYCAFLMFDLAPNDVTASPSSSP